MATTKTKTKNDALAEESRRGDAWHKAAAEASRLGFEFGAKVREARALQDERQRLIHRDPGLVNHLHEPVKTTDNPVAKVDAAIADLGDIDDLGRQVEHARRLEAKPRPTGLATSRSTSGR